MHGTIMSQSYVDDESSPLYCDPLYVEDYSYSILSKALVAKKSTNPPLVAEGANQVPKAEGRSTAAPKAVHEGMVTRGAGNTARKGIASTSQPPPTNGHGLETTTGKSQQEAKKEEMATGNEP